MAPNIWRLDRNPCCDHVGIDHVCDSKDDSDSASELYPPSEHIQSRVRFSLLLHENGPACCEGRWSCDLQLLQEPRR